MTDIDLLRPGDAGAARTLTSSNSTVTAAIAHPDADDTWFADCVANTAALGRPLSRNFSIAGFSKFAVSSAIPAFRSATRTTICSVRRSRRNRATGPGPLGAQRMR